MAKAKHTYAVRLAVEGGGKVKAELVNVGESGERSLKKIDRAGDKASRGLANLTDRAKGLHIGMRALGGALAGVAAVGGLATLIDRSISAADVIGKTADKIGVGVEALQELRYAAQLAGVEQRTMDMALQRFTRRVAEAAKGTGEAKQALSQMGIALKDQHGNIRRSEDLLNDVAEAFKRTSDPAERLRLAFKLFDSEGVAMVNMLVGGAEALEATRRHARDLGIVLEEDLVRNAEKARDQLDTLGKVVSANLTRAMLDLAPAIADASSGLADLAADAGVAYEQIKLALSGDFNFEGLSTRSTRRIVEERRQELKEIARELKGIGDVGFLDDPIAWGRKVALERRLQERVEQYRQWATKLAWLQRDRGTEAPTVDPTATPDGIDADIQGARDRSRRIAQIEKDLQKQLFDATHQGAERIRAEYQRLVTEMQSLITPDGDNLDQVGEIMAQAAAVRDAKLARLAAQEEEAVRRRAKANRKIIDGLQAEHDALAMTDRARFVSQALRRLSAEATDAEHQRVRELAGALFDERQAIEARNKAEQDAVKLREKGRALTESLRTAQETYNAELADLKRLLDDGAISQETFARASEEAHDRMLRASREWSDGVVRALRDYADEAGNAARQFEQVTTRSLKAGEDAFVQWAKTGKFNAADLFNTIAEEALRAAIRMSVIKPFAGFLDNVFGSIGASMFGGGSSTPVGDFPAPGPVMVAHTGGVIGIDTLARRSVDPTVFASAPKFHGGGVVGGEVPIIAQRGETVFTPGQMRVLGAGLGQKPEVSISVNVDNRAPGTEAQVQTRRDANGNLGLDIVVEKVEGKLARNIGRGEGLAPTLERRYGLNPAAGSY
ncbi:MAG: phage tail tape measure C-terminal domain-containing protein [Gammaproteobacteria bacterium]